MTDPLPTPPVSPAAKNVGHVRVSVIIPAYNMATYVGKAIESVLSQTHPVTDLIVVDDASSDNTREVVGAFGSRVVYVRQDRNRGVSAARNAGAARAQGDWFLFLDSDDQLLPDAIESLVKSSNDTAGVIYGRAMQRDEESTEERDRSNSDCAGSPPHPARKNFRRALIPTPGVAIVRRSVHEAIGGFEKPWQPSEDRDYWMKCGVTTPFAFCDTVVLNKLRRKVSSRIHEEIALFWGMRVQLEFIPWCHKRGIDTTFLGIAPEGIVAEALKKAIDQGAWRVADIMRSYALKEGIRVSPLMRLRHTVGKFRGCREQSAAGKPVRLFVSIKPNVRGGGSNTFSNNVADWARRMGHRLVESLDEAEVAIVVAHRGATPDGLQRARDRGCFIIHRIDEHLGAGTDEYYVRKHNLIQSLNQAASVTVYQSEFVRKTAEPFLNARNHVVILNGANPDNFFPGGGAGLALGHVTWSTIEKKRLDAVHAEILKRPAEPFLLVGGHAGIKDPGLDFHQPNAELRGECTRKEMPIEYRRMKVLFFPSENDPCPNTVIEAILCGVPVCYHPSGGTPEVVRDCGLPLEKLDELLANQDAFRQRCLRRSDLFFDSVMEKYSALWADRRSR